MSVVHSFEPIVGPSATTLILGSMPGVASLAAQQYYAHPRNAFWPIMGTVFGAGPDTSYADRTTTLQRNGIAVWDVLKLCLREGSLDSAIDESSIVTNDIAGLLEAYPTIDRVLFNGAKAHESYRRYVTPAENFRGVDAIRLPSTSPAHASLTLEAKTRAWASALTTGRVSESVE